MSTNKASFLGKANTLEGLIEGLDKRGILVLQILIGQQAMKLLSEEPLPEVKKVSKLLLPNAQDLRTTSIPIKS